MIDRITLRDLAIAPPFFLAPMAGITHAAFRRLMADFGGAGALYTEMLSAKALLHEDLGRSPYARRRESEGIVVYQLLLADHEEVPAVIARLKTIAPAAIDINLACPAPEIAHVNAGAALFRDYDRCARVLSAARNHWQGALTVKCRLGDNAPGWEDALVKRLRLFEDAGIDAVVLHPRFFNEKLKRTARWDRLAWAAAHTRLPLIGNGDIVSREFLGHQAETLASIAGIMIGRMAAARPWIFRELAGVTPDIDYREVWERFFRYVMEDFPPERALGRIKEFNAYYARNFFFGHQLFAPVQSAQSCDEARAQAQAFFSGDIRTVRLPSMAGV
jgi:tRNA-dihydrouridine synthase